MAASMPNAAPQWEAGVWFKECHHVIDGVWRAKPGMELEKYKATRAISGPLVCVVCPSRRSCSSLSP
eukprot:471608-Lingulodinium_polyedra.AAC.1